MVIYTAVEVRFGAAQGQSYRVESSTNLQPQSWTAVETGIAGNGGTITKFYSIRETPKRFFRAVRGVMARSNSCSPLFPLQQPIQ